MADESTRKDSFALHFISTLNTNCSVVDIGKGPVILIDLHQSEILEDMGRLFVVGGQAKVCEAMALRLFAEHFIASGREELGTYFAVRRSILMEDEQDPKLSDDQQNEIERSSAIQDVYVLTHEVAHLLWSRDQIPKDQFISWATRWIAVDAYEMAQRHAGLSAGYADVRTRLPELFKTQQESEGVSFVLSQIGPWIEKSGYSSDQLRATVERRCDPSSGFVEELWADFYAWVSSMQLFSGNWPAVQVYRNLT